MKKFFYDLETTGLNKDTCAIYQISGAIEIDGEIKEYFDFKLKPLPNKELQDKAMELLHKRGITTEDIMNYPEPKVVFQQLQELMCKYVNKFDKTDKFFMVGYNNRSFDDGFIRQFWNDMGDKFFGSFFWSNSIDVMVLATNFLLECRPNLTNFKLSTVSDFLGLEVDQTKLHDAEYDINLTYLVYQIVNSKMTCEEFTKHMDDSKYDVEHGFTWYGDIDYYFRPTESTVYERVMRIVKDSETSVKEKYSSNDLPF